MRNYLTHLLTWRYREALLKNNKVFLERNSDNTEEFQSKTRTDYQIIYISKKVQTVSALLSVNTLFVKTNAYPTNGRSIEKTG